MAVNNKKCEGMVLTPESMGVFFESAAEDSSKIDPNGKGLFPTDEWFERYGVDLPTSVESGNTGCQFGALMEEVTTDYCCVVMNATPV